MKTPFMKKLGRHIIRLRLWVIALAVIITLVMGNFARELKINADVLGYLPEDDPTAALFHRIGDTYGGNEMVIIGLECDHVFEAGMLDLVRQVTDSLRRTQGIGHVTSLTHVLDIRDTPYGIETGRLVDEYDIPQSREALDSLKAYVLSKDHYRGSLVSADATATLVAGKILSGVNRTRVVENIREKLEGLPFEGNIYYGGMPVILLELNSIIIGDILRIAPMAFLLISLLLFLGFRNARGVLLPMISVLMAATWTMGLIALLGYEITLLSNIIPVVLLAVGSAYAIHVVNAIQSEERTGQAGALHKAYSLIALPVALASVTTMLGFLSFIAGSYLTMIREFGIFSALGILFSLVLAVTFVPAAHSLWGRPGSTRTAVNKEESLADFATRAFSGLLKGRHRGLMAAWGLLIIACLWGVTRIERRVELVDYFREDNIVRKGENLLSEKFHGSTPLYVQIRGDVRSPEVLKAMRETQEYMEGFDYIPYSQSVADLIGQMNDVMGEGDRIPDDARKIAQLWFLLEGEEIMEQLVSPTLDEGIVQGFVTSTDLPVLREIETSFTGFARAAREKGINMEVTGIPLMFKKLDDSIIRSQTYSLVIATFLVMALVSLLFRSLRKGMLAIIPIGVTLIVLFGTMGLTGIPLDIATVLTGSVSIGIGIDYAIHFISRFEQGCRLRLTAIQALERAIRISGKAILINMVSVSAGFAILLSSELVPLQRFGFLVAVSMLASGMATLSLLPLLLLRYARLWKGEGSN